MLDVAAYFDDPDGDALAYTADSSDPGVAAVEAEGPVVTVTPVAAGTATATVSATDRDGSGSTARNAVRILVEGDYDIDDDDLIEVGSLAQLDSIRYDLDGDGIVAQRGKLRTLGYSGRLERYEAAFPRAAPGMGCPAGCIGYELNADLDFDTDGDGHAGPGDAYWNGGAGWDPFGGYSPYSQVLFVYPGSDFEAVFEGNRRIISGLFIDRPTQHGIGLLGRTAPSATVRNVRLVDVDVAGNSYVGAAVGHNEGSMSGMVATGTVAGRDAVGGLAGANGFSSVVASDVDVHVTGVRSVGGMIGYNWGRVRDVRAAGQVAGTEYNIGGLVGVNYRLGSVTRAYATGDATGGRSQIGGLAGTNNGVIAAAYATGTTRGGLYSVGGLVGSNSRGGNILASYASSSLLCPDEGRTCGALVGSNRGTITRSYAERHNDIRVALGRRGPDLAGSIRANRTTADLQGPAGYTGIYTDWNLDLDGDGEGDDPWTFESGSYPALKLDADGDGTATWREFGPQRGSVGVRVALGEAGDGGIVVTWDPPADTAGAAVVGYHVQRRTGDGIYLDADPPHAGTETTYADEAPGEGVSHAYRVRAVTDAGSTGWSAPASTAPGAPALTVVAGNGRAVLTWTDPAAAGTSAIVGYRYQRHAEGADSWDPPWTDVSADAAAARSYTVDGLVDGTRYGFEVRAVNASGPGFGSARALVTPGTPGAPRELRAVAAAGQATLLWTAPADPGASALTGYEYRHSGDGGETWLPDWTKVPGGPVEEHTVSGLANAAAYVFGVRAVNAFGPGPAAHIDGRTPPVSTAPIPAFAFDAHGDAAVVDLGRFFAVAPGGALSYEARSLDPGLVGVRVEGGRLVVTPNDDGEDGETTVTVRAVDGEGRVVETTFAVTVEARRGWWRRWGRDVVAGRRIGETTGGR